MCKSEIFAEILNLVGEETEVSKELILSTSKVTEVVDARSIVVFFLTEFGLYPEQIAALLHKTSASIRYLISLKSATIIQYTIKGRFMSR